MSFRDEVLDKTIEIERLIENKFGGTGRGLYEKLSSIEHKIPPPVVKKIKYIATVRNKLSHEGNDVFRGDKATFLQDCDDCVDILRNANDTSLRPPITSEPGQALTTTNRQNLLAVLDDEYTEIQYEDDKKSTSGPRLNLGVLPKWAKISIYAIGTITACVLVVQGLLFAARLYAPKSSDSVAAAPTPAIPDASKSVDVPQRTIDDYTGTYGSGIYEVEFYSTNKQYFVKEKDGFGSTNSELIANSPTGFKFVKETPYSALNGTLDFVVKNGKAVGFQITNQNERRFYKKLK